MRVFRNQHNESESSSFFTASRPRTKLLHLRPEIHLHGRVRDERGPNFHPVAGHREELVGRLARYYGQEDMAGGPAHGGRGHADNVRRAGHLRQQHEV